MPSHATPRSPSPPEPMRVVIADDEPLAREGLAADILALALPELVVVATCADGEKALAAIARERPEVLLLDVEMPKLDGFAVLERLEPEQLPAAVLFVTAYDEHAVRAFEARALDYLLKPVALRRLRAALERAQQRVREARLSRERVREQDAERVAPDADREDRASFLTQILVRDRGRLTLVRVGELDWIEADAYYVRLHAGGACRLLRERMSVLEAQLDPRLFFRTHRSAIVRLDRVREIRAVSRYEHEVLLVTGARAPLSRERRPRIEALLAQTR